jgi:hypothetical protein
VITADAGHGVLLARRPAQARAHLAQQVVPALAAEAFVHPAQPLHVDEDRGGEARLAPRCA